MSFCAYCGSQIPDGTKFCPECGQKVAVQQAAPAEPVQPAYEAPAQSYTPPVQQTYEAPQQSYTPPVQQTYEAPAQSYTPPVQQTYEAPAQSYTPPVQQSYEAPQQSYTPPVQTYTPPTQSGTGGSYVPPEAPAKAPKQKKPGGGKKIGLIIGIAAAAVVLVVALVLLLGGKGGKNDALLGRYEGVSCTIDGVEVGAEDEWIELKARNKADVCIMGQEFSGTWKLDGEAFTFKQGGDKYEGTLKDGVMTLDIAGMLYTFEKQGGAADNSGKPGKRAAEAGYWTLLRVDGANAMSEDDVAMFKDLGIEICAELKEDGTGVLALDNPVNVTWAGGVITADDGSKLSYKLEGDCLHIQVDSNDYVFTRGEGSAPKVEQNTSAGGEEPEELSAADWWSGKWYGWFVFSNASDYYSDWIGDYGDCLSEITVYDDGTGYVEMTWLDGEVFATADVTFGSGTTDYGCMMSESGTILNLSIEHADWIVDPGASMVSDFDHMIHIDSTMYDEDGDWIDYDFFLRPWGMEWEDVRTADTSNLLYDNMMPLEYDSWYLPQIGGGMTVSISSGDGYSGFDGPTDIYDYADAGEIYFEYPLDEYVFDNSFGIEALENTDGSVRITFSAIQDEYSIESLKGYIDGCSGYDEFKKEELTIGGYYALKATYLDEWGDAAESVYIEFGNDANTYLAILINVSAYTKQQRDSAEVQNIINSIQVN